MLRHLEDEDGDRQGRCSHFCTKNQKIEAGRENGGDCDWEEGEGTAEEVEGDRESQLELEIQFAAVHPLKNCCHSLSCGCLVCKVLPRRHWELTGGA
jgi:hypothetical protein